MPGRYCFSITESFCSLFSSLSRFFLSLFNCFSVFSTELSAFLTLLAAFLAALAALSASPGGRFAVGIALQADCMLVILVSQALGFDPQFCAARSSFFLEVQDEC